MSGTWLACCGGRKETQNVGGPVLAIKCSHWEVTYWPELVTPSHPAPSPERRLEYNLTKLLEGRRAENNLQTALAITSSFTEHHS